MTRRLMEGSEAIAEAAIAAGSAGIAISLADPTGVSAAAESVVAAGIPLYTLNSGVDHYKSLGAVTHVGQTEFVAGQGAGERFNALGATKVLCGRQDILTPLSDHEAIIRGVPGAELVIVEDCGHLATMERPEAVNAALEAWLAG